MFAFPVISNFSTGAFLPIPTFPTLLIINGVKSGLAGIFY
jgi:hypothetical protein